MILQAVGKILNKKTLKLYLELHFNIFFKKKIIVDCYNILTIGTAILEFHVNVIKN